ncbi:toxin glutamine deamidase domain-containing protein [Actinokineospora diospyrosa]|uniref:Papain fold toxin 1, glutamine deamidase n=1 Tax=Actinokineospora diospyrosa TaxID=103728 RepID=A0ABT1IF89_9PSEU|nr:toxin glutamine deamidase domain-containing protein [Actinokineospora diospyrosa]MCP2271292.1 Papain fold toxin 1, glutamine deamidase [Actinokineospora diospyrosa]
MAMMVPDEVRKLFQVLTGEEWPDANEDKLRALADAWDRAAYRLSGELAPQLRTAVVTIRSNFHGAAEQAFANRMAPYVEGANNYISIADEQFRALAKFLRDLALEVEYIKLVSILSLIMLIAEIAWAIAAAFGTAGASMAWLAARMAIVRWLLKSLLGRLLIKVVQAQIVGIAFQLVIDVVAQLIQFGMGTRTEWNPKYTASAAAVGALGGALTLPLAGFGKAIAHITTSGLDSWLGKIGKDAFDWHKVIPDKITEIGIEAFHETLTEALYKYATEGEFEMNPYSTTSGAVSGTGGVVGGAIGDALAPPKPAPTTKGPQTTPQTRPDGITGDTTGKGGSNPPPSSTSTTTVPTTNVPITTPPTGDRGLGGGNNSGQVGGTGQQGGTGAPGSQQGTGTGGNGVGGASTQAPPVTQPVNQGQGQPVQVGAGQPGQVPQSQNGQPQTPQSQNGQPQNGQGQNGQSQTQQSQTSQSQNGQNGQSQNGQNQGGQGQPSQSQGGQNQSSQSGQSQPGQGQSQNGQSQNSPTQSQSSQTTQSGQTQPGQTQTTTSTSGQQPSNQPGTTQSTTSQSSTQSSNQPAATQSTSQSTTHSTTQSSTTQSSTTQSSTTQSTTSQSTTGQSNQSSTTQSNQQSSTQSSNQTANNQGAKPTTPATTASTTQSTPQSTTQSSTTQSTTAQSTATQSTGNQTSTTQSSSNQALTQGKQPATSTQSSTTQSTSTQSSTTQPSTTQSTTARTTVPSTAKTPTPPGKPVTATASVGGKQPAKSTAKLTKPAPKPVTKPSSTAPTLPKSTPGQAQETATVGTQPVSTKRPRRNPPTSTPKLKPTTGKFQDFRVWVGGINSVKGDINCVDASVAFHSTWRGNPTTAGKDRAGASLASERTGYAPAFLGDGKAALAEVEKRVKRGGHGTDAIVFTTPPGAKDGHAWNVVNQNGEVFHVDAQSGTWSTTGPDAGKVWAIVLDPEGTFVDGDTAFNDTVNESAESQAIGDSFGQRPPNNINTLATQALNATEGHRDAATLSVSRADHAQRSAQAQVYGAAEPHRQAQAAVTATQAVSTPLVQQLNALRGQINTAITTLGLQVQTESGLQQQVDQADQAEDTAGIALDNAQTLLDNAIPANIGTATIARDARQTALDQLVLNHGPLRAQLAQATLTRQGTQTQIANLRLQEAAAHAAARGPQAATTAAAASAVTATQRLGAATTELNHTTGHLATTRTHQQTADQHVTTAAGLVTQIQTESATEILRHNAAQAADLTATTAEQAVARLDQQVGDLTTRINTLRDTVAQAKLDVARDKRAVAAAKAQLAANAGSSSTATPGQSTTTTTPAPAVVDPAIALQETAIGKAEEAIVRQETEIGTLDRQRQGINTQLGTDRPESVRLRGLANTAQLAADQQADAVNTLYTALTTARDNAQLAAQNAAASAQSAANTARNAKDAAADVKTAAKQGDVERGLTLLTDVPFAERIVMEELGDTTAVSNAVGGLFNDHPGVVNQAGQTAANAVVNHLGDIVNQGHEITVDLPNGTTARVLLTGRPKRPGDTRKATTVNAVPNSHPDVVKTKRDDTHNPKAVTSSSNLPVRVPFVSLAPIVDGGLFLRPIGSAGFTMKRSQGMTSNDISRPGVRTGDRPWVETDFEIVATRIGGPIGPVTATVHGGVRVPAVVPTTSAPQPLPAIGRNELTSDAVRIPTAFTDGVATALNTTDHRNEITDLLGSPRVRHMPNNGTITETIGGTQVTITPNGAPQITLIGPSTKVDEQRTGVNPSSAVTKGGDVTAALALAVGKDVPGLQWFVGLFSDFASGRSGGYNRGNESAVERNSSQPELVYQVTRPLTVTANGNQVNDTVTELVTVPVPLARQLNLTLPLHLDPTNVQARTAGNQPYIIGTDDITAVPGKDQMLTFLTNGLDATGQAAVREKFNSDPKTVTAIFNSMHGGEEVTWVADGRLHKLEIYTQVVPPAMSYPSGQAKGTVQDQVTSQRRRTDQMSRNAKLGVGGEVRPTFSGDKPANGNPNAAGTSSQGLPRVVISGTYERNRSSAVGTNGRDGRITAYGGEYRGFDGTLELVVVHRDTPAPNWFRRVIMGGKMTFGPPSADRLVEPTAADVDTARTLNTNAPATAPRVTKQTIPNAVSISAPVDKFAWSDKAMAPSTMTPGLYVGTAPNQPNGTVVVDPVQFGEFAGIEHVRVSPNSTEGLNLVLAKNVQTLPVVNPPANMPAPVTRRSPFMSGTWPSWGTRTLTETNRGAGIPQRQFRYKLSTLTKPGTTAADAVRGFVSQVGRRGAAVLGLNGEKAGPHKLYEPGRLTDMNGAISATATYSSPRVVDVRKDGQLQRRQDGDLVVNNSKHRQFGIEGELAVDAIPRRFHRFGARIRLVFGGNKRWGKGKVSELTPGGRQLYNYKGPTVWMTMDVRYTYTGDVNIRNSIKTSQAESLSVTVDEPDGVLVQVPATTAAELLTQAGLPIPPEVQAVLPAPPAATGNTQHLITDPTNPAYNNYASHGTTTVFNSRLHGPDPLQGVRARLDELGVTGKWQTDVLERITELFSSPRGQISLRDVLADSGVISIPDNDPFYTDVVDIRITSAPTQHAPGIPARPALPNNPLTPNSQTTYSYITTTDSAQETSSYSLAAGLQNDLVVRTAAPKDAQGNVLPGSTAGNLGALLGVGRQVSESETMPGSKTLKPMRLETFEQLDRSTHDMTYALEISRVRIANPAADALTLTAARHFNRNNMATTPVTTHGSVDLVAPKPGSSPAMTAPTTPATFDVLATNPLTLPPTDPNFVQQQYLDPDSMWHIESLGSDTAKAIREVAFAQTSNAPVPVGNGVARADFRTAGNTPSPYTAKGTTSEYALHTLTTGTGLHNGGWSMFSNGSYSTKGIVGAKRTFHDELLDVSVAARFVPGSFTLVPLNNPGKVDHGRETEDITLTGSSRTVTWSRGITASGLGGGTVKDPNDKLTPAPATLQTTPTVGVDSGIGNPESWSNGAFDLTVIAQGGRSYLFNANAEFYVQTTPRRTNVVMSTIKGWFGRQPVPSTVKITTSNDVRVRVWEADALRQGLITLADVYTTAGTAPPAGLAFTPAADGIILHPQGTPAVPPPGLVNLGAADVRGRTLRVEPGVTQNQVVDFVAGLGLDLRPRTFVVPPGSAFTAQDIADAVAARTAPGDVAGTALQPDPVVPNFTPTPRRRGTPAVRTPAVRTPVLPANQTNNGGSSSSRGPGPFTPSTQLTTIPEGNAPGDNGPPGSQSFQMTTFASGSNSNRPTNGVDEVTGPWNSADHMTTPEVSPAPTAVNSNGSDSNGSRGTKRSREDFESDFGAVTHPEPPGTRSVQDTLTPASAQDVLALEAVVPTGTRFTDPALFVDLVNGDRTTPGRDINCVDAAVSFHSTYHGQPRVAGIGNPGQAPRGAVSKAAEWTSYAPEFVGTGSKALGDVIERVTKAGHGADAMLIAFGANGGRGHAWNVVNHNGTVSLVDPQQGTIVPATPDALPGLGRVHAIPLDANNQFIPGTPVRGLPTGLPSGIADDFAAITAMPNPDWAAHVDEVGQELDALRDSVDSSFTKDQADALSLHLRAVDIQRMRALSGANDIITLRGTEYTLVPYRGGYRLVSDTAADPGFMAEIAASILGRSIFALVIGADAEAPQVLEFPPRGRPLPVDPADFEFGSEFDSEVDAEEDEKEPQKV